MLRKWKAIRFSIQWKRILMEQKPEKRRLGRNNSNAHFDLLILGRNGTGKRKSIRIWFAEII